MLAEVGRLETPAAESGPLEAWNALVSAERSRELPRVSLIQEAKRLLGTTSIDGRCPLCGQTVDEKKLARRIEASLVSLLDATQELERCRDAVLQWSEGLRAAHERRESLARRAKQAQIELPPLPSFPRTALEGPLETLAAIEAGAAKDYQSQLRRWDQTARETGRKAAPAAATTRESQLMMLAAICGRSGPGARRRGSSARPPAPASWPRRSSRPIRRSRRPTWPRSCPRSACAWPSIYLGLHPGEELGSVSIEPWTAKGVELAVDFYGSKQRPPHGVLSESHLNSLAIALFLAMAETFNEKLRFLVLDDVINSFDREHRSQLADLLANEFSDWQLVVLTHDRQFFEHLTRRAPSWKKLELTSWSYGEGPRTTGYEAGGILRAARELLERGDVGGAAGKARRALEEHLQEVCEGLEAPLAFRRGQANERRDIGELFKGLRRALKEHARGLLDELEPSFKTLEADVGATLNAEVHASRGRSGLSEVEAAVKRIEELDRKWNCPACATRIWHRGGPQSGRCKCGKSAFPPVPVP